MSETVSIVKVDSDLTSSIRRGIDILGGLSVKCPDVFIKPNICVDKDLSGGANIHTEIVRSVIDILLEESPNLSIRIVESDSSNKWIEKAFRNNGYTELVDTYRDKGLDVRLVNLSKSTETGSSYETNLRGAGIPDILLKRNYFISIARAKTHGLTDITGVLKNQFGCLPMKEKSIYHNRINMVIPEVNRIITSDLCIVDAVTGMEGVISGVIRKIGVLILGYHPASTDATLARVMGFDPRKIEHIVNANRVGLGSLDPQIVGTPVEEVSVKFRRPSRLVRRVDRYIPDALRPLARVVYRTFVG